MTHYKPSGYNSVHPYFVVDDAESFSKLVQRIFNAIPKRRFENDKGKIVHAELKIDDSVIMFADSNERYPSNKLLLHVYVKDADEIYQKAISSGCQEIQKPVKHDSDPDKRGTFEDPFGNIWSVATQAPE